MELRLVLDEDTERELATKLRAAGHDGNRVVEADKLEAGATDDEVRNYAQETERIIVTHDDDHIVGRSESHVVFYVPNQRMEAFQLFRVIQRVAEQFPENSAFPPVVFLTDDWLP